MKISHGKNRLNLPAHLRCDTACNHQVTLQDDLHPHGMLSFSQPARISWNLFHLHFGAVLSLLIPLIAFGFPRHCLADEIDFGRDIRPILSDKCFQCHGVDEATRHADLRLDLREAAIADRAGNRAIVPHHPDQSLILARMLSSDDQEKMPPRESNKQLSPDQIKLIRQWIQQGANYSDHWAFQPVQQPSTPATQPHSQARNEIDAFILKKLEQQQLQLSPEADRYTLIRRLYQDLLGLLPSPAETQAFVQDNSPDAYEQLVDRLLSSPHYGERWGRHWLDQARYADSNGFTIDGVRIMWPYRDWVIQAINQDMPFDQFTIEQLAGDLLPQPDKKQLIATGFHRNSMINEEGGVKPDQYRHEAVLDRVNTTGAVWLGLTISCAQCHSHKFDPVSHDEFHRLYAFFNGCEDTNNRGPTIPVYQQEMFGLSETQLAQLQALENLRQELGRQEQQAQKLSTLTTDSPEWNWQQAEISDAATESNGSFQWLPDGSILSNRNGAESDTYHISIQIPAGQISALRLRVLPHPSLPQNGPGLASNGNFVLTDAELHVLKETVRFVDAIADHEQPGFPALHVLDEDQKSGWAINVDAAQKQKSPDLAMNAAHELVLVLGNPVQLKEPKTATLVLRHEHPKSYVIGRLAIDVTMSTPSMEKLRLTESLQTLRRQIKKQEAQLPGKGQAQFQMIMKELKNPPPTYRLDRGDFLQPDLKQGPLTPGVPEALTKHLPTIPEFQNRLDLARWLVSQDNPLTSRVTVNRIWMRYFGRGLVETENDFGFQGSLPTHPELLDWLADFFMKNNWSMKTLHRKIVNSATYRQQSLFREKTEQTDPRNLLLSRQSRFRVESEIIRDMALSASGLLTTTLGGPSVFPPQPEGVYSFTQTKKKWEVSRGADRYRRTMYTALYRSAPHPLLSTFDAPDFSTSCTQRPRSNTPLQALTIANDQIFVELSQGLAQRVMQHQTVATSSSTELSERIDFLFQLCLTRLPNPDEQAVLQQYWKQEQQRYLNDPQSAAELTPTDRFDKQPSAEAAAWISLARVVLNTDEFVTRN